MKNNKDMYLVILLSVLTFLLFSTISIARHYSLNSEGYDLGIFDQAVWNTAHGDPLFCSLRYPHGGTLLGDHFEPILFFIVPLYWLWPNVLVLLILQSFLLASAIIPLYLIAKSVLKDRFIIFVFLICYMLSKPLRGFAFSDFYPEAFVIPALFWGYYFLIKRKNALLWMSILILLLCKEDATLLVLGLGLFVIAAQQRMWLGFSMIALAFFLYWWETAVFLPHFSPTHQFEYLNRLPFGATYGDNLKFCIFHPLALLKFIFIKPKIEYLLRLFSPLCFLSLLSPPHFILFFIPVLKNLLATKEHNVLYTINSHYGAGIIPFIFIAAIYGCGSLLQKLKIQNSTIIVGLFLIGFSLLLHGKSDEEILAKFINDMKTNHTMEKIRLLDLIPPDASVIATDDLCPHLSHRKYIYEWDPQGEQTIFPDYIAIDKVIFDDKYLRPKQLLVLDNYLSVARSKGYKTISTIQNNNFLILASP